MTIKDVNKCAVLMWICFCSVILGRGGGGRWWVYTCVLASVHRDLSFVMHVLVRKRVILFW
jgi:hypothetical protein